MNQPVTSHSLVNFFPADKVRQACRGAVDALNADYITLKARHDRFYEQMGARIYTEPDEYEMMRANREKLERLSLITSIAKHTAAAVVALASDDFMLIHSYMEESE